MTATTATITKVRECYVEFCNVFDAATDTFICIIPNGLADGDDCQLHLVVEQTIHEGDWHTPTERDNRLLSASLFKGGRCLHHFGDDATWRLGSEFQVTIEEAFV